MHVQHPSKQQTNDYKQTYQDERNTYKTQDIGNN